MKRKPAPNSDALKVYRDGREVCQNNAAGAALYKARTIAMAFRQEFICCICRDPQKRMKPDETTFEHTDLRGMGSARRDDRILDAEGKPMNGAAHSFCNAEKGSKRDASNS
jgi:hypothetical protein